MSVKSDKWIRATCAQTSQLIVPFEVSRSKMNEKPKEIPAAMLDAATAAILRANGHAVDGGWIAPYLTDQANREARATLEAADVPKMLADRERIGMALFTNGYDAGYTTDGAVEVIEMMAARIAELGAELAKHQEGQFHPDWPLLQATRESLAEAWGASE